MSLVPYISNLSTWQHHKPDTVSQPFHPIQSGRGVRTENNQIRLVSPTQQIIARAKSKLKKRINSASKAKRLQSTPKRQKKSTTGKKKKRTIKKAPIKGKVGKKTKGAKAKKTTKKSKSKSKKGK